MTFVEAFWKILRKNLVQQYGLKIDSNFEKTIEVSAINLLNQQSPLIRERIYIAIGESYPNFKKLVSYEQFNKLINEVVKAICSLGSVDTQ